MVNLGESHPFFSARSSLLQCESAVDWGQEQVGGILLSLIRWFNNNEEHMKEKREGKYESSKRKRKKKVF